MNKVFLYSSLLLAAFASARAASVLGLGDLPGGQFASFAYYISADGTVVRGLGTAGGAGSTEAIRWTSATGMQSVNALTSAGASQAYLWGMPNLTYVSQPGYQVAGYSPDGSVVVGSWSNAADYSKPFMWTSTGGYTFLPKIPYLDGSESPQGVATDVSSDGKVVVGTSRSDRVNPFAAATEAVRWTESGLQALERHDGTTFGSAANAISADGNTIVGEVWVSTLSESKPFVWTESTGLNIIGAMWGLTGYATGVSGDGSVVIGYSESFSSDETGFIWTATGGMKSVRTALDDLGVSASDWSSFGTTTSISLDGRYVVGTGVRNGHSEAYLLDLSPVPEPSSVAALSVGLALAFQRRKHSRQLR
jgi:probable HAF family extracellular repeat protein